MFPIDPSKLPALRTRKALLVVDPQNDFLDDDGALPINYPVDLAQTIAGAAQSFRANGFDIIWVRTQFEKTRSINNEMILTSDLPLNNGPASSSKPRGSRGGSSQGGAAAAPKCPESFLSLPSSSTVVKAVQPETSGTDLHPAIQEVVTPRDPVLVKSFYSAFKNEQLLRMLRMRIVTELYVCGSLTNVGVMATAYDAASHGFAITIVKDCCGYRSAIRHHAALKQIVELTGCDVLDLDEISLAAKASTPKASTPKAPSRSATPGNNTYPTMYASPGDKRAPAAACTELDNALESLSLQDSPTKGSGERDPPTEKTTSPTTRVDGRDSDESDDEEDGGTDVVAKEIGAPSESRVEPIGATARPTKNIRESTMATDASLEVEKYLHKLSLDDGVTLARSESVAPQDTKSTKLEATPPAPTLETEVKDGSFDVNESPKMQVTPSRSEGLCEGDSQVIYNILPFPLANNAFETIRDEVQWQRMSHQGGEVPRLVAVQGQVDEDGSMPVYRHPSDESPPLLPFSPTVTAIKEVVEKELGHPLNHALIQFYRHGNDYISEHSDKTLDIAKGSFIANVSLGAERTMVLRTKRAPKIKATDQEPGATTTESTASGQQPEDLKRRSERAALPHNSLMKMGLQTNMKWLHGIRQDKRQEREKTEQELAFDGSRISLTFRRIGTFLDAENTLIWGQGATGKTRDAARDVVNGQTQQAVDMLRAFGRENQLSEFDWDAFYGKGFDVLHITASPRLFLCGDSVVNMRVQMMLAEYGIGYARGSMATSSASSAVRAAAGVKPPAADASEAKEEALHIRLIDADAGKSNVQGDVAIMLYLDRVYGSVRPAPAHAVNDDDSAEASTDGATAAISTTGAPVVDIAKVYTRFQQALSLLDKFRAHTNKDGGSTVSKIAAKDLREMLGVWETYALEAAAPTAETPGDGVTGEVQEATASVEKDDAVDVFIASTRSLTLADFALWPVLHEIVSKTSGESANADSHGRDSEKGVDEGNSTSGVFKGLPALEAYYARVKAREGVVKLLSTTQHKD
ncbi:hypothetical protein Micbo1qcDRAFT_216712 [Microdochium bolleyi]|uniref:Fe2OG dioxygenase domain-containing protein n=1 Tax=Microdochium bolleyi TaxID=196109 RepID=A0A136JD26_9PEZI|nr:hypothetical protein Micbo1qcDRAFT_216712 [Microdochium bolleyi]